MVMYMTIIIFKTGCDFITDTVSNNIIHNNIIFYIYRNLASLPCAELCRVRIVASPDPCTRSSPVLGLQRRATTADGCRKQRPLGPRGRRPEAPKSPSIRRPFPATSRPPTGGRASIRVRGSARARSPSAIPTVSAARRGRHSG